MSQAITKLPVTKSLQPAYASSLAALIMAAASLAGIFLPIAIYPTAELRSTFMSNDVVNLIIGLLF